MSTIHQSASKLKGKKKKKRFEPRWRLFGAPKKRGLVEVCRIMTPRKPNSAKRKICRVNIRKTVNKRRPYSVLAKLRGIMGFVQKHIQVLVSGGRANDLPGVRYMMIRNKLSFTHKENIRRKKKLSKYGIKNEMFRYYQVEDAERINAAWSAGQGVFGQFRLPKDWQIPYLGEYSAGERARVQSRTRRYNSKKIIVKPENAPEK